MQKRFVRGIVVSVVMLSVLWRTGWAQGAKTPQLSEYMMDRDSEIALARTAAPKSISENAEVLVLGPHGYEVAVKGTNGFACFVERSWTKKADAPDFWNSKMRAPFCVNAPAVRSYLPITELKTRLVLAGKSNTEIAAALNAAFDSGQLPPIERDSLCYMMSKQGDLGGGSPWHSHVMVLVPVQKPESWGADLAGSPVLSDEQDRHTIFMIPVAHWSDGSPDEGMHH